jgi:PST family polysaccharide transporter
VGPQTVSALLTVAIGFMLQQALLADFSRLARFVLAVPICTAVYLAVIVGAFRVTAPLQLAFSLLRDFSPSRLRRNA